MRPSAPEILPAEIWREALHLHETWGEEAEVKAARQADACLDAGDLDGRARWRLVLHAIDCFRCGMPLPGDARA